MTVSGLDFRSPVRAETFNCFKNVCIIERNTNESSKSDPSSREVQNAAVKKVMKSTHKVQQQEEDGSGSETEPTIPSNTTVYGIGVPSEKCSRRSGRQDNILYGLNNSTELVQKYENKTPVICLQQIYDYFENV